MLFLLGSVFSTCCRYSTAAYYFSELLLLADSVALLPRPLVVVLLLLHTHPLIYPLHLWNIKMFSACKQMSRFGLLDSVHTFIFIHFAFSYFFIINRRIPLCNIKYICCSFTFGNNNAYIHACEHNICMYMYVSICMHNWHRMCLVKHKYLIGRKISQFKIFPFAINCSLYSKPLETIKRLTFMHSNEKLVLTY